MVMLDINKAHASASHPPLRQSLAVLHGFTNFHLIQSMVAVPLYHMQGQRCYPWLLSLPERLQRLLTTKRSMALIGFEDVS
jgi:hypothetical protein